MPQPETGRNAMTGAFESALGSPRQTPDRFRTDRNGRIVAGLVGSGCAGLLAVATWLTPAPTGHGTHQQLGLPPCNWAAWFDSPCMTCGMTTSFAHAADMDLFSSFRAQPAGMLLSLATAVGFWVSWHVALTGSRLGVVLLPAVRGRRWVIIAGLFFAAWFYKIATWHG